jgi:hypothetical protein
VITFFTTAKPFKNQMKVIQVNAIRSWQMLTPSAEILLFGSGVGYVEAAKDLGITHVPEMDTSELGTPLVNSMIELAGKLGRYPVQVYINCDIILTGDFLLAIQCIKQSPYLMVGQRWDLDLNQQEINFQEKNWESDLKRQVNDTGTLHPPSGSDYFAYQGRIWDTLPRLAVGRPGFDNYLIYHCLKHGVPVIDASRIATVVHQKHDYSHVAGGAKGLWNGVEARSNYHFDYIITLVDADWMLSPQGDVQRNGRRKIDNILRTWLLLSTNGLWKILLRAALKIITVLKNAFPEKT